MKREILSIKFVQCTVAGPAAADNQAGKQKTMKTIYILWIRQLKRYVRSKSRMIGSLAQPLLFLISLGYGFGHVFEQAGQGSYINYLAPGIIAMSIIFSAIFMGMELIWDRQ